MAKLPPRPKGGYDVDSVTPAGTSKRKGALKEFISADGTDFAMHDYILGADDQFVINIPYRSPHTPSRRTR